MSQIVIKKNSDQAEKFSEIFQGLAHELRLKICLLVKDAPLSVSTICADLDAPQHRVSQQLAILRSAGIVDAEKKSRQVFYSIKEKAVLDILALVSGDKSAEMAPIEIIKAPKVTFEQSHPQKSMPTENANDDPSFEAGRFSSIR